MLIKKDSSDLDALFDLGRRIYALKFQDSTEEQFDSLCGGYAKLIQEYREFLLELQQENRLNLVDPSGNRLELDLSEAEPHQVISIFWELISKRRETLQEAEWEELKPVLKEMHLMYALTEIDNALIGLFLDGGAVVASIDAANALSNAIALESGNEELTKARRQLAYTGAIEKLKKDPKQKEKLFVKQCWDTWQDKPSSYPSKAEFSRDMLTKCEHLKSQKKIEDWCREWEKSVAH